MRSYLFAKRNLKEIVREPLSIIFCLIFPLILMLLFQVIILGIGVENLDMTPQFKIENLVGSMIVFGFSFIMLFLSLLMAKDRTTAFLSRLRCSPLKTHEFLLGYALPMIPVALVQIVLTILVSFIFGLNLSVNLLLFIVCLMPSLLIFIALGLLIGSVFNDKVCGGVCSIIINLAAFLGGMFMPLDNMKGVIVVIANIFPFAPLLKLASCGLACDFSSMQWQHYLSIGIWFLAVVGGAIMLFAWKLKKQKKG